ncbi:MAG: hypothetical protein HQM08_16205 [Candidatus Riflebacteria bacterium]|nr:hypothetical protein [Candidatus Riflebacteria bacterium]
MLTETVEQIYLNHVKPLKTVDRLRLVEKIVHDIFYTTDKSSVSKANIMDLHCLGKEIWKDLTLPNLSINCDMNGTRQSGKAL